MSSDGGRRGRGLSRREALGAAAGVAGTVALGESFGVSAATATSTSEHGLDNADWVQGSVLENDGASVLLRDARTSRDIRVTPGKNATIIKAHRSDLAAFVPGDEVIAAGTLQADGSVRADLIEPVRRIEALKVKSRRGAHLETDATPIRFGPHTRPRDGDALGHRLDAKPLDQIRAGDSLVVEGRRDPHTGELLAIRVGAIVAG